MKRNQTFHETLIPLLVDGFGSQTYLELGTHLNETIGRVTAPHRYGVDTKPIPCPGAQMFRMTTGEFIEKYAASYAPFDFVFIDADHCAKSVGEDFDGIWPYVSDEGLVCLHDTNPEREEDTQAGFCGDAWKWASEKSRTMEMVTLPYHPGLTIVRKRVLWGPQK